MSAVSTYDRIRSSLAAVVLIISFLPGLCHALQDAADDKDVIAVVLGRTIIAKDKDRLQDLIFGSLLEKYAREHALQPTDAELDAFVSRTEEMQKKQEAQFARDIERLTAELKSPGLTDDERKKKTEQLRNLEGILRSAGELREKLKGKEEQMKASRRNIARHFVRAWKINRALYEQYGGRIIFQQAGPEPLDAYRRFLEEQQKKGAFMILRKEYEEPFWRYFTDDKLHTFYNGPDGEKLMKTPWWLMDKPL